MLILHRTNAERVSWKGTLSLKGDAEQKIGERISGIGSVEGEGPSAAGRIDRISAVVTEEATHFQCVASAYRGKIVGDLILVVAKVDWTKSVGVKAKVAADCQTGKTGKFL